MSLINDALKRAKQSQSQRPPERPVGVPLQPVEPPRQSGGMPFWLFPLLMVSVFLLAGWFLLQWWQTKQRATPLSAEKTVIVTNLPPVVKVVTPAVSPLPPTTKPKITISTNLVVRTNLAALSKTVPAPITNEASPPIAQPLAQTKPLPAPATTPVENPHPETKTNVPAPVVVAASSQLFPVLNLQGIFYRLSKPSALINGQTLYVGEAIKEARVIKIERQSVTVEWNGQSKVLNLQ